MKVHYSDIEIENKSIYSLSIVQRVGIFAKKLIAVNRKKDHLPFDKFYGDP